MQSLQSLDIINIRGLSHQSFYQDCMKTPWITCSAAAVVAFCLCLCYLLTAELCRACSTSRPHTVHLQSEWLLASVCLTSIHLFSVLVPVTTVIIDTRLSLKKFVRDFEHYIHYIAPYWNCADLLDPVDYVYLFH